MDEPLGLSDKPLYGSVLATCHESASEKKVKVFPTAGPVPTGSSVAFGAAPWILSAGGNTAGPSANGPGNRCG